MKEEKFSKDIQSRGPKLCISKVHSAVVFVKKRVPKKWASTDIFGPNTIAWIYTRRVYCHTRVKETGHSKITFYYYS